MSTAFESFSERVPTLAALFRTEGKHEAASGNHPFLLSDPQSVWFVETGRVEVFTIAVKNGEPSGAMRREPQRSAENGVFSLLCRLSNSPPKPLATYGAA